MRAVGGGEAATVDLCAVDVFFMYWVKKKNKEEG